MKLYILADQDGKPIVKKKYKIPLTDRGGPGDEYAWDMYISLDKADIEDYIRMGGNIETVFELDV